MASAPTLRSSLSPACFGRGLEGFRSRVASALQPSGIAELDLILGGGFPRGSMVEVCGPVSSGRTSLSLALLTQATERQEVCAVVDVSESLDPASVAAAGVDLSESVHAAGELQQLQRRQFFRHHLDRDGDAVQLADLHGRQCRQLHAVDHRNHGRRHRSCDAAWNRSHRISRARRRCGAALGDCAKSI